MQIAQPIVHLEIEGGTTYHIHVITWFDQTKFVADGYDTLPSGATDGVFPITLFVAEDSGVPFIEVEVINTSNSSSTGKKKAHKETAGNTAMPDPGTGTGNRS